MAAVAAGVVLALALAASNVGGRGDSPQLTDDTIDGAARPSGPRFITEIVRMNLVVTVDGQRLESELSCGQPNSAEGFLGSPSVDLRAACVAAVVNPRGQQFIRKGTVPRDAQGCRALVPSGVKREASLVGVWNDSLGKERFARTLVVDDSCEDKLWAELLPLLEGTSGSRT